MDQNTLNEEKRAADTTGLQLKILLWLLAAIIIGGVVCLILGLLKAAVSGIMTVAGVLLAIALVVFFIYERTKWKYHETQYKHEIRRMQDDNPDNLN